MLGGHRRSETALQKATCIWARKTRSLGAYNDSRRHHKTDCGRMSNRNMVQDDSMLAYSGCGRAQCGWLGCFVNESTAQWIWDSAGFGIAGGGHGTRS